MSPLQIVSSSAQELAQEALLSQEDQLLVLDRRAKLLEMLMKMRPRGYMHLATPLRASFHDNFMIFDGFSWRQAASPDREHPGRPHEHLPGPDALPRASAAEPKLWPCQGGGALGAIAQRLTRKGLRWALLF